MNCVFCKIIDGDAQAEIVEEGRGHIIIKPLNPHTRGHVLVIPKRHVSNAVESPRIAGKMMKVAAEYLQAQGPQGNLLTSSGVFATQTVDHLHVHVIPRGPSQDLPADWPWMREDAL